MEEVISNSHGTGLLIVNSDPIILNDAGSINTLLNNNGSLLQGALKLLEPAPKNLADSLKLNLVNGDMGKDGEGGCIIVDGSVKLDSGNIIQLSIDDLNKLGLQLTFDNGDSNCDMVKATEEPVSGELFLSSLTANKDKLYVSTPDTIAGAQLEPQLSLNVSQPLNITNFSSVLDENTLKGLTFQQLEVVTPFENDNMTYTLQLDGGSSGLISRSASVAPATASVSTANDTLIVSNLTDTTTKKIALADQLKSDGKYSQIFRVNSKPTNIDLKPKTFIKTTLNGVHHTVLSKMDEDKAKLMKISKGQSLIVKNKNSAPNIKLNQHNLASLGSKTKRICILNKNIPGIQTFEKNETSHKLLKVAPESIKNKTEAKPVTLAGGVLSSNHGRLSNRIEASASATTTATPDSSTKPNKVKRLTPAQLQQIAAYLEKNRDDQGMITNPSTFYDTETNTKIICRVVYPEDFENGKNLKKTKTPTKTKVEKDTAVNDTEVLTLLSFSRTRSGRLSRPPKHITVGQPVPSSTTANEKPATTQTDNTDILESGYGGDAGATKVNGQVTTKAKASPKEFGLSKKGVSWKKKIKVKNGTKPAPLSEVIGKYSEVEIGEAIKGKIADLPLWQCLLLKVSSSPEKDKVRLLCDELTSFAKSVAAAADQFLKPMSPDTADSSIMLKSETLCALFNKSMGVYSSDSDALMKFYGDKRKREDEKDVQVYKKSKSEFNLQRESSLIQPNGKDEESLPLQPNEKDEESNEDMLPINNVKEVKTSLDLDLSESVDELVNQRLASLQGELVNPNLGKSLGDDLLSNLLSRSENKKCDKGELNIMKTKENISLDKKEGKSPPKFENKNTLCEVKGSIDLDLGESVDELVNQRLASLTDEIVPSLPSRALGDDVLVGLLSDTSTSLFSHIEKSNTATTSSGLLSGTAHTTPGIFSSLEKDISVSSSRSMLNENQSMSGSGLFSSLDKRVSPSLTDTTQSSSDLFSTLEKRVTPSDSLLGDQSSSSLFASLDKSFASTSGSNLLIDARSSSGLFPTLDKCVSTPDNTTVFPSLEKQMPSPSPSLLSSSSLFSSLDSPTTTSSKRVTSTSSRSLLRTSQNSGMLPPAEKSSSSRILLNDSVRSSVTLYPSLEKHVSSSTSSRNIANGVSTVSSTSDLFPSLRRTSASTEDLLKSLENLSAEIPAPSSAPLQDFSLFSQHFSRESKTAI